MKITFSEKEKNLVKWRINNVYFNLHLLEKGVGFLRLFYKFTNYPNSYTVKFGFIVFHLHIPSELSFDDRLEIDTGVRTGVSKSHRRDAYTDTRYSTLANNPLGQIFHISTTRNK